MTCNFESEVEIKLDFDYLKICSDILECFADVENSPYEMSVDILFTDDEGIQIINSEQRDINSATDVLSFPMNDFAVAGDYSELENDFDAFDPDSGELLLGDIVLSQDHILSQANEFGHSTLREFAFLIVHSLLHLTGYDHMEEEERILMEDRQRVIMEALNILR